MKGKMMHGKMHPGFAAEAHEIADKETVSEERAEAILAAGARKASPAARAQNPRLKRVRGIGSVARKKK